MWESIKKLFGFGKKEEVVVEAVVVKSEPVVEKVAQKVEAPKTEAPKAPKKPKAPKAPKAKEEVKVTAKEIKAKVKKENPVAEKTEVKKASKSRKPKTK